MTEAVPTLADLTPGFLTEVVRARGYSGVVEGVSSGPIGTGQVGATYRLTLEYGAGLGPPTLVAKLPSNDPLSRATGKSHMTYIRESRFYQNFAGRKPMAVPDHLFIAFDDETHDFALIMHDLPHHVQGDQLRPATLAEARLAMTAAASIHAGWWGDPMLDTLGWLNGTKAEPPPLDIEMLYGMFWPGFRDRYGDRVTEDMRVVGDAFMGRMGGWSDARTGPRCLTHNDFRPDNMLYDPEDAVKPIVIVDWQTVGVGPGAGDIAYYAGTALDPAERRAEEAALIDHYKAELGERGVPGADLAGVWDDYRASAVAGFLMGVTASMVVQQTDRGDSMFLAMAGRSAAMVRDHWDRAVPK